MPPAMGHPHGLPPPSPGMNFQQPGTPQNMLPSINQRSSSQSKRDEFFKNPQLNDQDQKQLDQERKREYAMELQKQIANKQQLPPKIPPRPQVQQSLDIGNAQDDPRFQEILRQKREEYKMQLDDQMRQKTPQDPMRFNQGPPPGMPAQRFDQGPPPRFDQGQPPQFNQGPPPGFSQGPPPAFSQGPPSGFNQGPPPGYNQGPPPGFSQPPPVFNQVPPHQGPPPQFDQGPPRMDPNSRAPPDESDLRRQKIEEYKRDLDAQMKSQQSNRPPIQEKPSQPSQFEGAIQHALPGNDSNPNYNMGGRARSDITSERKVESNDEIRKKMAYQEELKQQMEQAKAKKEMEKLRQRKEDEEFERQLQKEREKVQDREKAEMKKEGKKVDDDKPGRKVNLQQFQTSDQIEKSAKQEVQNEVSYKPFTMPTKATEPELRKFDPIPKMDHEQSRFDPIPQGPSQGFDRPPNSSGLPQGFERPSLVDGPHQGFDRPPMSSGPPQSFNPIPQGPPTGFSQGLNFPPGGPHAGMNFPPSGPPTGGFSGPPTGGFQEPSLPVQQHSKLLDDQKQMLEMYQEALQQILDFRNQCFKEAMGMQINLMKEREQIFQMQQQQQVSQQPNLFNIPGGQSIEEYQKQAKEIQQLQAVKQQIGTLIQNQNNNITPIINPQVQNNLNTLIKSQRDQIVRMSQSINIAQSTEQSPERLQAFDQSLSSNSKLISVPNQFANKLKEKADGFEQQRLMKSPRPLNQSPVTSPKVQQSANKTGLYQTWKNQPESAQASINERADRSISPTKAHQMQASLIGSSHLQYMQPGIGETQDRMFSPIPQRSMPPGVSPARPRTNIQETIQELPEKEQNLDNTNDYDSETIENAQKKVLQVAKIKQSIETDLDFNNRDDDMTQYSKSIHGRKSKVSQGKVSAQIEKNLNFIENQVNLANAGGRNYNGINSNSKEPFQSDLQKDRRSGALLSPGAQSNQMINIGQALQSAGHKGHSIISSKPLIPTSTEKSFYKPQMGNTGMQGAKVTGSSFYNATMAKTKQQEQVQQEELQKQLLKIFSPENEEKQTIEIDNLNNTEEIENMSNINIAQSVMNSIDIKEAHQQFNNYQFKQNNNFNEDYEYNLKQTNGIINEQEFESKSRSIEESGSNQQTMRQQEIDIQSQTQREGTQRESQRGTQRAQDPPQGSRGGQEGPIWDDPDLIPSYYDEGEPDQAMEFQFEGTQTSNQQFEVVQETEKQYNPLVYQSRDQQPWLKPGTAQPYDKESEFQKSKYNKESEFKQSNYDFNDESSYNIAASQDQSQMYQGQNAKSGISNLNLGQGLYSEEPAEEQYQTQDHQNFQAQNQQNLQGQDQQLYQGPQARSGISNLNLGAGLFSEEPQTALLVKKDSTLNRLQKCSPSTNNFNSITPEEEKKQIDEMYAVRESQQQQKKITHQETSDIYPPQRRPFESRNETPFVQRDPILDSTPNPIAESNETVQVQVQESQEEIQKQNMKETSAFPKVEEELQGKLDKIKGIFNEQQTKEEPQPIITPRNHTSNVPDQFSVMRPRTMDKQQEILELTKLIQAATGSVGQVVETSQQLPAFKIRREKKQIEKAIQEDKDNDNQILSDLDQIINNLEKQQKQSEKIQSKFSSNKAYQAPTHEEIADDITQTNEVLGLGTEEKSDELRETKTIEVDQVGQIKMRPISSQSTSTNRYGQTQKKNEKYEQFDEEEDDRPDTVQTTKGQKL